MNKFRCLGKTKAGKRCQKTFLSGKWSRELTCSAHKNQTVDFQYSPLKVSCPLRDVALIIAKEIRDPRTFSAFAQVSLSTAKACHKLQSEKKSEFSHDVNFYGMLVKYLPNGDML